VLEKYKKEKRMENPVQSNEKQMEEKFVLLAECILNKKILRLLGPKKQFRITEIEFYYCDETHKDLYTHRHPLQLKNGEFYLHRLKNGISFKEGTYKCMDYTMGCEETGTYFGILIRSMTDLDTQKRYNGPCVCVRHLFSFYGENLKSSEFSTRYDINTEFVLKDCDTLERMSLKCGTRIGLNADSYPEFYKKKYRYVSDDHGVKEKRKLTEMTIPL
jgi:hypothetical protein